MLSIELKNLQLKFEQEASAHEKTVAVMNENKKRTSENHNNQGKRIINFKINFLSYYFNRFAILFQ